MPLKDQVNDLWGQTQNDSEVTGDFKNLNGMDSGKKMEVKQVNSEYRLFFFEYRLFKEFAIKQEMGRFCWL